MYAKVRQPFRTAGPRVVPFLNRPSIGTGGPEMFAPGYFAAGAGFLKTNFCDARTITGSPWESGFANSHLESAS